MLIWHPLFLGNYLLFHSLVELFAIVVAFAVFALAWNTRRLVSNDFLLFLGVALLFVAGLDLLHTLAYRGMGVFEGGGANLAAQLWIAARLVEACSLWAGVIFLRRRLPLKLALTGFGALAGLLVLAIFQWQIFPTMFIEGQGLTTVKRLAEALIIFILLLALVGLFRNRERFDRHVYRLVSAAVVMTILAELCFTLYEGPEGFYNMLGHYFKVTSFWLIYKALADFGLRRPFDLLFRDLKRGEELLRLERDELERTVADRTSELRQAVAQLEHRTEMLQRLAAQLTEAEQRERRRLAQVLHDHLQQLLVAARMQLAVRLRREEPGSQLGMIDNLIEEAIGVSRSLSVELSPPVLHDGGLVAGLRWLAESFGAKQGLQVEVEAQADAEPEDVNVRVTVFNAVRELLFNVVKHAGVDRARVEVARDSDMMRVTVSDQGAGFEPEGNTENFGLLTIRERIGFIGGRIEVHSAPGQGVRVDLYAPLAQSPVEQPVPTQG